MSTVEEQPGKIVPENVSSGIQSVSQSVKEGLGNARENLSTSFNEFSQQSQAGVNASSQFLQSNTIVAKVVFILMVIIGFVVLLSLGILFLTYMTAPPRNPFLIYGMIDGGYSMEITQDPSLTGSVYIQKSNNQNTGIEFTWSFWIYVKDTNNGIQTTTVNNGVTTTTKQTYQHVFNKGNRQYDATSGMATVNNAPGVYLKPSTASGGVQYCSMHFMMDTVVANDQLKTIDIDNIPIRKWVHVAMRMENTVMDVYVNGTISKRLVMNNVPKQNYDNVYICQNGGFNGKLSNMRYYSYALNVFEINNIVSWGPNLTEVDYAAAQSNYYYLSRSWYSYNQ
jgi:hypothetical protein